MPSIKVDGAVYDLDLPIYGAKTIGKIRNQSERQTFHAAASGLFEHRKNGRVIVSTPREALLPLLGEAGIARLIIAEREVA
jgi:hypothetical protein